MKILLTGASGQLGQELAPRLRRLGSVVGVDRNVLPGDDVTLARDLGDMAAVQALLEQVHPDMIVNAAAFTAVDAAEDERETAFLVNETLPGVLARWCAAHQGFVLHYSTDYVFDGAGGRPYTESDPTGPLSVYGESKLAGEAAVISSACRHLVVRTSWVYSSHGSNFVLTMLRLAAERPSLDIVDDQSGCPTWARSLAAASLDMFGKASRHADGKLDGLYHYCDTNAVTWFEFANTVFDMACELGILENRPRTSAVDSSAFPQKATRPAYSVLDASRAEQRFGITRPTLRESLRHCLEDLLNER